MTKRRAAAGLVALALVALCVAWSVGLQERLGRSIERRRADAARAALVDELFAPILELEALRERARGLDGGQQQALLFELARDGLLRLPDQRLVERLALLRDVTAGSDQRACAMVLLGGAPDAAGGLLEALDLATLRRWLELSREAVLASLRDDPPRPLAPADAERALAALVATLPPADAERLRAAPGSLAGLDEREACALARASLEAAMALPATDRQGVARLLASG